MIRITSKNNISKEDLIELKYIAYEFEDHIYSTDTHGHFLTILKDNIIKFEKQVRDVTSKEFFKYCLNKYNERLIRIELVMAGYLVEYYENKEKKVKIYGFKDYIDLYTICTNKRGKFHTSNYHK